MSGLLRQLSNQVTQSPMGYSEKQITTRERLVLLSAQLADSLAEVNEAIAALDSNPEFERIHNLLSKVL